MAKKLDRVMSAMCWCIVLREDKRMSSNAADQWQHCVGQTLPNFVALRQTVYEKNVAFL